MRTRGLARTVVLVVPALLTVLLAGLVRANDAGAAPVSLVLRPSVQAVIVAYDTGIVSARNDE